MRKSRISHFADTFFWYAIYMFPIIAYLLLLIAEPGTGTNAIISLEAFFDNIGLGLANNNIIVQTINSIFGESGILPLFKTNMPTIMLSWFVSTYIVHLAIDVLLFIPRFAHKFIEKTTQGE